MEWLKKHWGILAAIAVGIPLVYWLYQTYQSNQVNAAQNASADAQANELAQDEADYQQQTALANLTGGGVGSSGGSTSSPSVSTSTISTPVSSTPNLSQAPISLSSTTPTASQSTGVSASNSSYTIPQGDVGAGLVLPTPDAGNTPQYAGFDVASPGSYLSQLDSEYGMTITTSNFPVAGSDTSTPPSSPTLLSTLFGGATTAGIGTSGTGDQPITPAQQEQPYRPLGSSGASTTQI